MLEGGRAVTATREQVEDVMRAWGLTDEPEQYGDGIHSWRCEHPDRYGRCTCFTQFAAEMTAVLKGEHQ